MAYRPTDKKNIAYLGNKNDYIHFNYGNTSIRFKGPYSLKRIEKIKTWDNGYIVVDVEYSNQKDLVEDYIDLVPILQNLYIDAESFLKPIKEVRLDYVAE